MKETVRMEEGKRNGGEVTRMERREEGGRKGEKGERGREERRNSQNMRVNLTRKENIRVLITQRP